MVAGSCVEEAVSPVPFSRLWKASVDATNLVPKIMPALISGITLVEGKGEAGSVQLFKFTEAMPDFEYVKQRIDVMDQQSGLIKATIIEGGFIGTKLKSCTAELKLEPTAEGATKARAKIEYDTLGNTQLSTEDEAKLMGGIMGITKAMEGYLLANPNAYV